MTAPALPWCVAWLGSWCAMPEPPTLLCDGYTKCGLPYLDPTHAVLREPACPDCIRIRWWHKNAAGAGRAIAEMRRTGR